MRLRLVIIAAAVTMHTAAHGIEQEADLVVRNAQIYTVELTHPWAEALAVKNGRISFVGSNANVRRHVGPLTRVVDAGGRFILPGFHDAHVHLVKTALKARWCDLDYPATLKSTQIRLADCVKAAAGNSWVLALNANTAVFPKEGPELSFLDSIARDQPLFVDAIHAAFVNTAAMQVAGVSQTTQAPAGGVIVRNHQGQPTGTFRETAKQLIEQHVPKPSEAEFTSDFESVVARLPSYGIVSVQEITGRTPTEFFDAVRDAGKLPVRVRHGKVLTPQTAPPTEAVVAALAAPARMYRDRWLSAGVIKIHVDGDLADQTASLLGPYVGSTSAGEPLWRPELLNAWAAALDRAGLQLYLHAVGDRAVRMSLDAVQHAQAQNGRRDARHQITHLHLVSDADLPRFKQLGVIANIQPSFATNISWNTDRALEFLGPKRHATMFRFRDMLAAGAELAGGTDTPAVTADQLITVQTAVTRQEPDLQGGPFLAEQRLTRTEAIELATLGAARANFLEEESGSITVGKWADFVMLDKNLFLVPAHEIHRARILWTVIEGRDAYVAEQDTPLTFRPSS